VSDGGVVVCDDESSAAVDGGAGVFVLSLFYSDFAGGAWFCGGCYGLGCVV